LFRLPLASSGLQLTTGLKIAMLLGFETWRVNQSYAVDLQLRLLLQRGVAVRYVALVIIAAALSSFRLYLASSGFHIGIRSPLVLVVVAWNMACQSKRCKSEIIKGNYDSGH
jgi:hypothetical protein